MSPSEISRIIQGNLQLIHEQIADACRRSNRDVASVQLVAVTKYAEWEWVQVLATQHGVFGENRPQQLAERHQLLPQIEWHLIGQLQRNKVKVALEHASLIHSVDSLRLLERIAQAAGELHRQPQILLQVNVSGEPAKSGFATDELLSAWPEILKLTPQVRLAGLMTMAAETDVPDEARPAFRTLRELRNELATLPASLRLGLTLPQLSMGMSGDFVPAVEEGATLIRIGSRIFHGLEHAG